MIRAPLLHLLAAALLCPVLPAWADPPAEPPAAEIGPPTTGLLLPVPAPETDGPAGAENPVPTPPPAQVATPTPAPVAPEPTPAPPPVIVAPPPSPGGPPEITPNLPKSGRPSVYVPRPPESHSTLRMFGLANLAVNPAEQSLEQHRQVEAWLLERRLLDLAAGGGPAYVAQPPRLLMADVGFERSAVQNQPVLPNPKDEDSIYPGEGYDPLFYPAIILGPINAVRASVTLSPAASDGGWQPILAIDARVPLQSTQGSTEILGRAAVSHDRALDGRVLRLGLWAGFQSQLIGFYEPVPSGQVGLGVGLTHGSWGLTRVVTTLDQRGSGDFFNQIWVMELEQSAATWGGRLVGSAGARLTVGVVDEAHYTTWTGAETPPFSVGRDLEILARTTLSLRRQVRLHALYSQVIAHAADPFLDGFYRATGPQLSGGLSVDVLKLAQLQLSFNTARWTGAVPRPSDWTEDVPPVETYWSQMLTIGVGGRF